MTLSGEDLLFIDTHCVALPICIARANRPRSCAESASRYSLASSVPVLRDTNQKALPMERLSFCMYSLASKDPP